MMNDRFIHSRISRLLKYFVEHRPNSLDRRHFWLLRMLCCFVNALTPSLAWLATGSLIATKPLCSNNQLFLWQSRPSEAHLVRGCVLDTEFLYPGALQFKSCALMANRSYNQINYLMRVFLGLYFRILLLYPGVYRSILDG